MRDNYKGVGVVFVRKQVRALGPSQRERFYAQLTDAERACLDDTLATHWVPVEHAGRLFEVLGKIAYADAPSPLREVGRQLAGHDLGGVYRLLVRITSVRFLLSQHARLWSVYHRQGEATVAEERPKAASLRISGHPSLPASFRVAMAGWLIGAVERCGGKDVVVDHDPDLAPPWRFDIRWR